MTTTYTSSLRLTQPGVGDVATQNAWGALLNTDMALIEAAMTGKSLIDTAGASTLTLTTANGATDQARPFCLYFTDSSGGTTICTVTIPAVIRFGLVQNTCNHVVALTTTGSAPYLIVPANSTPIMYYCDGTNVLPALRPGFVNRSASYSGTFTTPSTLVRFRLWGGGGGSGNAQASTGASGGGGGGAYCEFTALLGASASITASVGTGGNLSAGTSTTVTIPSVGITATAGGGAAGSASTAVPNSASGGAAGTATLTGASGILSNGLAGGSGTSVSISGTIIGFGGLGGTNSYGGAAGGIGTDFASFYGAAAAPSGIAAGGSGGCSSFAGQIGGAGQLILDW